MRDVMFEAPDIKGRKRTVTVTRDMAMGNTPAAGRRVG